MENDQPASPEQEFAAIQAVFKAMEPLDDDARARVAAYIASLLGLAAPGSAAPAGVGGGQADTEEVEAATRASATAAHFGSLAELFDATRPRSNAEKALVAGYWLQVCEGAETFDGFSANSALKQLGEGIANITNAIDGLKNQKPALALQLRKSGKAQQARKVYKVTVAGIRSVEEMIAR